MTLKNRYLIAILPDPPISEDITRIKEQIRENYQSKGALNAPPHITLHMPFEFRADREADLIASLAEFSNRRQSFDVELKDFGAFPPRVIFVGVEPNPDLLTVHSELSRFCRTELNLLNANYRDQPFHPHVTVAFRDLKKQPFELAWDVFERQHFSASFRCRQITLLRHNGSVWQPLAELTLGKVQN